MGSMTFPTRQIRLLEGRDKFGHINNLFQETSDEI